MVKLSPAFRCASYGLRVAAFMIQVPCSQTKALKQVPIGSDAGVATGIFLGNSPNARIRLKISVHGSALRTRNRSFFWSPANNVQDCDLLSASRSLST
jgi:hypothetical protein